MNKYYDLWRSSTVNLNIIKRRYHVKFPEALKSFLSWPDDNIISDDGRVVFYGIREMLLNNDMPTNGQSLMVVSRRFLEFVDELNFRNYKAIPMRIFYIRDVGDYRLSLRDSEQQLELSDGDFFVFLLTDTKIRLFDYEKTIQKQGVFVHRADLDQVKLPLFFREELTGRYFVNEDAKEILISSELKGFYLGFNRSDWFPGLSPSWVEW